MEKVTETSSPLNYFEFFKRLETPPTKSLTLCLQITKLLVASLIHWNGFASGTIICNEIVLDNVNPQNRSVQERTYNFLKGGGCDHGNES